MNAKPILIDLPEALETSRLLLQMPKAGYGPGLHEAIMDGYDDYVKWLGWDPKTPSSQVVEEECRKHHAEFILREFIRYIIIEKETKRIIGRCAFPSFQAIWPIPLFGISYFIRRNARHHGYATEAAHALALLAFQNLKAKKVEIYCDAENGASQKIPQKLGFALECVKKGGWPRLDGQLGVLQTYALFSEEPLPKWEVKW